ncbi:hypothetical protein, partial [Thauera sp. 27]|uniref:hypothetical protein n=1 Tax=Thauera sp. 27 TaxID=305700 RepID=UPI001E4ECA05
QVIQSLGRFLFLAAIVVVSAAPVIDSRQASDRQLGLARALRPSGSADRSYSVFGRSGAHAHTASRSGFIIP